MKRILAVALAAGLLLSGCGVIGENNQPGAYVSTSVLDMSQNEYTGRVLTSAVYFYNETSKTLTAELRKMVVETGTNPAEVAVKALLEGPSDSSGLKRVAPEGMKLDFIEFSRQVANVYLLYEGQPILEKDKFTLELAIANTVTDILGATYICVFINGQQTGISSEPYAPLKKQTSNMEDAWRQASALYKDGQSLLNTAQTPVEPDVKPSPKPGTSEQHTEDGPFETELQTVLYYVSSDNGYLLPEVHAVKYTQGHAVDALIAELKKNPNNTALMKSPLPDNVELLSWSLADSSGGRQLALNFSEPIGLDTGRNALSYAAVIYTLTGFIPGVNSISLSVAGQAVTTIEGLSNLDDGIQRSDFVGYIGSSAPLYFADKNSDLLLEVSRSMEQEKTWSARARVLEMLKGPLLGDGKSVWPVMPPGVTEDDILSVNVYADTAYINLSQHFKDACANMSAKTEMLLVYAMVNTITAMDGVSKVQFLIESAQTQTLAGTLCLADPFLKNYGIIKKSS